MAVVGQAQVLVVPTFKGFQRAVQNEVTGAGDLAGKAGGSALGSSLAKWGKRGAAVAGGAIAGVAGAALVKGFGRLKSIEEAQAKMRGLGHDADAVRQIMDNALASVRGTAFGLGEAATTAAGAVAAGIKPGEELEGVLKTVANSAAAAGVGMDEMGSIFNKAASRGKAQNDVLNQVAERGIPIYQALADQFGVTAEEVFKMASRGEVSFADFTTAMTTAAGTVADEMGTTFTGSMKNMWAGLGRVGANFLSGIFPRFAEGARGLTDLLAPLEDKAKVVGEALSEWLNQGIDAVQTLASGDFSGGVFGFGEDHRFVRFLRTSRERAIDLFGYLRDDAIPTVRDLGRWLRDHSEDVKILTGVVLGGYAAYKLATGAQAAYTAATFAFKAAQQAYAFWTYTTTGATNVFTWALHGMKVALLSNPIGLVAVALVALGAALVLAYRKSETFRNIVDGAWKGIQAAVKFAWERVIQPIFRGLVWYVQNVIVPTVMWLWNNVFQPAFRGISKAVEIAWAMIRIAFDVFKWYIENVVAPPVRWLYEKVIKPAWGNISSTIKTIWENVIRPAFQAFGSFIEDKVAPAFRTGVDVIKAAWESIQDAARKPINFIIETVYMNGIKKVFDKIAEAVDSKVRMPVVQPIGLPAATPRGGGSAQGTPRARAKGGWTPPGWTLVGEEGPELVDFRTPGRVYTAGQTAAFMHGRHPNGDGWGGPAGWLSSAKDWVVGKLRSVAEGALGSITDLMKGMGGGTFGSLAQAAVKRAVGLVLGWAGKKDEAEGTAYGGGGFVRGNGTGSASSLLAFGRLMQSMGARVGEHPAFGGVRGRHMVGSRHYSGRALDINYGPGGENAIEKAFFDRVMRQGLPQSHGLNTLWRTPGHHDHMHVEYDRGGWLKPGVTSVVNNTGKPEAVFTHRDSLAIQELARNGGFPAEVTLVDADGSILTRARVVARQEVVAAQSASMSVHRGGVR